MEDARIPTSEQLMAEMSWVRKLARALVKDDALADDIAQDDWLIAAKEQPDIERPLRPWLSRVVSNLVRTRRRSDERRELRDAEVDRERAVPTPAELLGRVELQRAVAEELLALAEPYRSTVLLHFIEGLSSADIARRRSGARDRRYAGAGAAARWGDVPRGESFTRDSRDASDRARQCGADNQDSRGQTAPLTMSQRRRNDE